MILRVAFSRSFNLIKDKINLLALAFCGLSSCLWMLFLAKWYYFRYTGSWDTAYFIQTLLGLKQGHFFSSILGSNFLADHCHFLCFILAPLYWIFPDPVLLRDVKICIFFVGAYVFFLILKKTLHPLMAFGAMVAFTIAPANVAMLRFVFNYEVFAVPLIFLIFKAFSERKYYPYIIYCFLLMMVKEQMPLVVMGFGLYVLLTSKEERIKWAYVPLLIGLIVFIVEVFVLLPYVREKVHLSPFLYWNRYAQFGKTPNEIFLSLLIHPQKVWAECLSPLNIQWYKDLFGVWGWLSFLSPYILLPALPLFLKMALSSEPVEHSVTAVYYACVFTPFIFLAVWNTLNRVPAKWRTLAQGSILTLMFVHGLCYIIPWINTLPSRPITANLLVMQRFINEIPSDASVLSCRKAMPYLANRRKLYQFKDYINGYYYLSGAKFELPKDIDYILLDFNEFGKKDASRLAAFNFDHRFTLKESIGDVALYIKNDQKEERRLIERSSRPFLKSTESLILNKTLSLERFDFPAEFSSQYRIFPTTMYWNLLKETKRSYGMFLTVTRDGRVVYKKRRTIGSTIYPTNLWKAQEYVKESYSYLLPRLEKGEYLVRINIYAKGERNKGRFIRKSFYVN